MLTECYQVPKSSNGSLAWAVTKIFSKCKKNIWGCSSSQCYLLNVTLFTVLMPLTCHPDVSCGLSPKWQTLATVWKYRQLNTLPQVAPHIFDLTSHSNRLMKQRMVGLSQETQRKSPTITLNTPHLPAILTRLLNAGRYSLYKVNSFWRRIYACDFFISNVKTAAKLKYFDEVYRLFETVARYSLSLIDFLIKRDLVAWKIRLEHAMCVIQCK